MKLLSAVVPCYNEEGNVTDFYMEFMKNESFFRQKEIELELWYIDDGSKDKTAEEVKKLIQEDGRVHLLSFSRNFGKEAAIYAGLEKANGDYIVFLDADLQDPPAILPEMYGYLEQGYDSVATRRVTRKGEPVIRSLFARLFYRIMKKISDTEIVDGARDYRLMTRQVAEALLARALWNDGRPGELMEACLTRFYPLVSQSEAQRFLFVALCLLAVLLFFGDGLPRRGGKQEDKG